jgi:hypothetical protein
MKIGLILFLVSFSSIASAQSFNEDKISMINYVKRMFNSSPFEGAKLIEGEEDTYRIAAISLAYNTNTLEYNNALAERKAQEATKKSFAEPCIKFEMLSTICDTVNKTTTYFFSCQPLSDYIKAAYAKQVFEGAKIISTPKSNYFVCVIALDPQKYTSGSLMDRVASIKAKQQANTLFNGAKISSDVIIKTDEIGNNTSTEIIREQAMGFIDGLEILNKFPLNEKKVYIFYRELLNK